MIELAGVLSGRLSLQTGTVAGFDETGLIHVQTGTLDAPVRAYFLRTSDAPPPRFSAGDAVLIAIDADEEMGYVLGAIAAYSAEAYPADGRQDMARRGAVDHPEALPRRPADPPVEISLPRTATDAMRLKGNKIYIEAGEEIQLTCGGGTISIDKRGKIVVRGTDVVSRARRSNKIKGGTVAIN